jgi:transcriptional regulator with XRE-family HTH domain
MDWKALIADLEGAGLTQKDIAEAAGCSQPYVSQLKAGQRRGPDYEIGKALVELHQQKRPDRKPDQPAAEKAAA